MLLAAKLDTLKFEEHSPAANLQVEAQKEALVLNQIRIFNDASSHFQRVLRGGLLDEQKQKLAEAARERYESQRRANDRGRARAYEACRQPAEQKLVLEVLKRYPSQETLKLAVEATQVAELKEEAAAAVLAIIQKLGGKANEVSAALSKVGLDKVKLEIVRAEYGAGAAQKDVTAALRKQLAGVQLIALSSPSYNEAFGGDPAPNVPKQLKNSVPHQ